VLVETRKTFWGKFQGEELIDLGRRTSVKGTVYQGEFDSNIPHGHGVVQYTDGTEFKGQFQNGKKHGLGILMNPTTNEQTFGSWSNGVLIGPGKVINAQFQTVEFCTWENGEKHGQTVKMVDGKQLVYTYDHGKKTAVVFEVASAI
jgi:hypothetical protein